MQLPPGFIRNPGGLFVSSKREVELSINFPDFVWKYETLDDFYILTR